MKLKLDENLGNRGAAILRAAGHDVATVPEQQLAGAHDRTIAAICQRETRCLVTLDVDFANLLLFDPREYAGIAVLRLPRKPTGEDLASATSLLADALTKRPIEGKLWIVQVDRIREYQQEA